MNWGETVGGDDFSVFNEVTPPSLPQRHWVSIEERFEENTDRRTGCGELRATALPLYHWATGASESSRLESNQQPVVGKRSNTNLTASKLRWACAQKRLRRKMNEEVHIADCSAVCDEGLLPGRLLNRQVLFRATKYLRSHCRKMDEGLW